MMVGDLVRWILVGDLGFVTEIDGNICMVYCFINRRVFIAYMRDLEVVNECG